MSTHSSHIGLALLVLQFVMAPILLAAPSTLVPVLVVSVVHGVLFWSLTGVAGRRWWAWPCLALVAAAAAVRFWPGVSASGRELWANIASALAVAIALGLTLVGFVRSRQVRPATISNAISLYLLAGYLWSLCYSAVEAARPGSFTGPEGAVASRDLHYFSYVTMTTLGYGDIAPRWEPVRILALSQAVFGQMFVAVVLGRLIGLQVASESSRSARVDTEAAPPLRQSHR